MTYPLILALGDSLIAGYGLPAADALPAQLEMRLRTRLPGARVINAGVSGDTSADLLRRLPRVLSALPARADLAVVQVGPNDVLRGEPPQRLRANLDAILTELGRCSIPMLLTTVNPPALLRERAREHSSVHPALGEQHRAMLHPFFPPGVLGHHGHVLRDRMHPNAVAIAKVAAWMAPAVRSALAARLRRA